MENKKEAHRDVKTKDRLHPRNRHRAPYDFDALITVNEGLATHVSVNKYGNRSIDFFNPAAVYHLNKALVLRHYEKAYWDIPRGFLCPPIPGRANYIHYLADLLGDHNCGRKKCEIPTGININILDIGTGANCIYPIIGQAEYSWSFIGSEINQKAIDAASLIVEKNSGLKSQIKIRKQDENYILKEIIKADEYFDAVMCNPPFYRSRKDARAASITKLKKLTKSAVKESVRNFSGTADELWTKGGEVKFINQMIEESRGLANSCFWFTSLVSKESHLKNFYASLRDVKATKVKTIKMNQGQKSARILAWTFLSDKQQADWASLRWAK